MTSFFQSRTVALAVTVLTLPLAMLATQTDDDHADLEGECTGYMVLGHAGGGSCYLHKNRDSSDWREGVALVVPKEGEGYKYLVVQTDTGLRKTGYGGSAVSGMNVKGVAAATYAGFSSAPQPKKPWAPSSACREALQHSATASDYVKRFGQVVKEHGIPGGMSGVVSPTEGWKIEYAGHYFASDGPLVDDYAPIANAYTLTAMKKYDAGGWSRFGRLRKARELLERELYPSSRGQPWFRTWDITKAFAFARNQEALECPISGQPGTFGPAALPGTVVGGSDPRPICDSMPWGRPGRCVSAHIAVPDKRHPEHLSVLWWSLDRPNISPFIPLFIGITEVPPDIEAKENMVAARRFHQLRLLAYESPKHEELIADVWRKFEIRQHRAVLDEVFTPVRARLDAGEEAQAQAILNVFTRRQVEEMMTLADKLIVKIQTETAAQLEPASSAPATGLPADAAAAIR